MLSCASGKRVLNWVNEMKQNQQLVRQSRDYYNPSILSSLVAVPQKNSPPEARSPFRTTHPEKSPNVAVSWTFVNSNSQNCHYRSFGIMPSSAAVPFAKIHPVIKVIHNIILIICFFGCQLLVGGVMRGVEGGGFVFERHRHTHTHTHVLCSSTSTSSTRTTKIE